MDNKEFRKYSMKMEEIQLKILEFIDSDDNDENKQQTLFSLFDDQKIRENHHDIKTLLHLIIKITDNHHRSFNFFNKIEQIIMFFQEEIKENFTNFDIFNIFKSNKRILLFLIEKEFIHPDSSISHIITNSKYKKRKYPEYFYPEFKSLFDEKLCQEINYINQIDQKNYELFEEKRKIGENSNVLAEIIRNDSVEDFIVFVAREDLSLFSQIESSIFETNLYLLKNKPTLMEYAAFFGSIPIIRYLLSKYVKLTSSLWFYSIHSQNADLIHLLEENHIELDENGIYVESIKCHHIDFMDYLRKNLLVINSGKFSENLQ